MQAFQELQLQLTEHIRQPTENSAPAGIEDRRLQIYRELLFNNVCNFVDSAFPVLKSLHQPERWQEIQRDFFASHDCQSPYFIEISKEFLSYWLNEREHSELLHPFIHELAHYEWVELDISARKTQELDQPINLLSDATHLYVSETAWPLAYQFAVHKVSANYTPTEPEANGVYIVVYRDTEDEVAFLEVNAVTARLLQHLLESPGLQLTGLIEVLHQQLPQLSIEQMQQSVVQVIGQLAQRRIVCTRGE